MKGGAFAPVARLHPTGYATESPELSDAVYSRWCPLQTKKQWNVNNSPLMQFSPGTSRNTKSKSYTVIIYF